MPYNKAKAEMKWKKWKEKEEEKLRELNMPEESIRLLREYDWNQFKSDRRFYERQNDYDESFFENHSKDHKNEAYLNWDYILDNLEDYNLYNCLRDSDCVTKSIVVLKMNDYTTEDISIILKVNPNVIYKNVYKLRKKFKKMAKK